MSMVLRLLPMYAEETADRSYAFRTRLGFQASILKNTGTWDRAHMMRASFTLEESPSVWMNISMNDRKNLIYVNGIMDNPLQKKMTFTDVGLPRQIYNVRRRRVGPALLPASAIKLFFL